MAAANEEQATVKERRDESFFGVLDELSSQGADMSIVRERFQEYGFVLSDEPYRPPENEPGGAYGALFDDEEVSRVQKVSSSVDRAPATMAVLNVPGSVDAKFYIEQRDVNGTAVYGDRVRAYESVALVNGRVRVERQIPHVSVFGHIDGAVYSNSWEVQEKEAEVVPIRSETPTLVERLGA